MTITVEQVIATLEEVVAEKGEDYVYQSPYSEGMCVYANPDGTPSCIVGHLIYRLDQKKYNQVVEFEKEDASSFPIGYALRPEADRSTEGEDWPLFFDWENVEPILTRAQEVQDDGKNYGMVLTEVKKLIGK